MRQHNTCKAGPAEEILARSQPTKIQRLFGRIEDAGSVATPGAWCRRRAVECSWPAIRRFSRCRELIGAWVHLVLMSLDPWVPVRRPCWTAVRLSLAPVCPSALHLATSKITAMTSLCAKASCYLGIWVGAEQLYRRGTRFARHATGSYWRGSPCRQRGGSGSFT